MAPPADLREIGLEGFALIDKFYGPRRRTNYGNNKRDGPPAFILNSKEAAAYCGGVNIVSYPKPKPQTRWGRPLFKP